ncbi:hypothetical protein T310_9788, partial [Rasamsonia emersonii CBS 393.64]
IFTSCINIEIISFALPNSATAPLSAISPSSMISSTLSRPTISRSINQIRPTIHSPSKSCSSYTSSPSPMSSSAVLPPSRHINKPALADISREHNIDSICYVAKTLLEKQIFESTLRPRFLKPSMCHPLKAQEERPRKRRQREIKPTRYWR